MFKINHTVLLPAIALMLSGCQSGDPETSAQGNSGNVIGGVNVECTSTNNELIEANPRAIAMCSLAQKAYLDAHSVALRKDYRVESEPGKRSTGFEFKGAGVGERIGSVINGTVVGVDVTYGNVVVEAMIGEQIIRVGHKHLADIPVTLVPGSQVIVGDYIGTESNQGLKAKDEHRLVIEMTQPCLGSQLSLDTDTSSLRWDNAIDPFTVSEQIYKGETSQVPSTPYFNVTVPRVVYSSIPHSLAGCIYAPQGLQEELTISVLTEDGERIYQHSQNGVISADTTIMSVSEISLGLQQEIKTAQTGSYEVELSVSPKEEVAPSSHRFPFSLESMETVISLSVDPVNYYSNEIQLQGCIHDPEGLAQYKILIGLPTGETLEEVYSTENGGLVESQCNGIENSVDLSQHTIGLLKDDTLHFSEWGTHTVMVKTEDRLGNIAFSELGMYDILNPVKGIGLPRRGMKINLDYNTVTIYRLDSVELPSNGSKVDLPSGMFLEIGDQQCTGQFAPSNSDFREVGITAMSANIACPHITSRGSYEYTLFHDRGTEKVELLTGSLYFDFTWDD